MTARASHPDIVERLAGGIAHEFDGLLSTIVSEAESLADCLSPGDPRAAQVAAIRQAAEQAAHLTQQLAAFSRTQTLRPTVIDVNEALARAGHGLQRVGGGRIAIETRPGRGVWPVHADAEQFDRILHLLAVNARSAMPDGGECVLSTSNVLVSTGEARCPGLTPGEYVELSIVDSGAEIQSASQARRSPRRSWRARSATCLD